MKPFARRTRDTLAREPLPEKGCCRRAELSGLVRATGIFAFTGGGVCLALRTENPGVARRAGQLLRREFGIAPALRMATVSRLGGRTTFELRLEAGETARLLAALHIAPMEAGIPRPCLTRKCCRGAFLRGMFLGSGTLTDPSLSYQLEFRCPGEAAAGALMRFLRAFYALRAGASPRKGGAVVYVKDAEGIKLILSVIGARGAIFDLEEALIHRDARNHANRAANCDAANITRMLGAAERQLQAIGQIQRTIGLNALPEALQEIALERQNHPEATLEELGAMLSMPVGKSGVYHRLKRLEAIAQSIAEQGEGST
ncbi:MAG: DNA-binding protein WhiA [Oscillospiraceae bacterium]|jgi:DNA-binding protein WhiA|nr:DNA-binding protein WhiA [Oscillospiraceae bacterium]